MATNYTGTHSPPPGQDSPAPGPGSIPIVSLPVDADPNNVSTMFLQQYRILADYAALVQASGKKNPLISNPSGSGFGAVAHVGPGGGTITPSLTGSSRWDGYIVIKIIGAGGLGVGTFQWSNDGGGTYGPTTAIPGGGIHTDTTSGVVVTFAGAFVALDTYAFRCADVGPSRWADNVSGIVRHGIDHLGMASDRYSEFIEMWDQPPTANTFNNLASPGTVWPGYPRWRAIIGGGGGNAITTIPAVFNAGLRYSACSMLNGVATNRIGSHFTISPGPSSLTQLDALVSNVSGFGLTVAGAYPNVGLGVIIGGPAIAAPQWVHCEWPALGAGRLFLNGIYAGAVAALVGGTDYQIAALGTIGTTTLIGPVRLRHHTDGTAPIF